MGDSEKNSSPTVKSTGTIMTELQRLQDTLKDSLHRVEVIEKKLNSKLLTLESREKLEQELELVKKLLYKNEEQLDNVRFDNTNTFMYAMAIVFIIFLLYELYHTINDNLLSSGESSSN